MTNEEIIMGARISLMEAGLIGTTGRILTAEINGEKKEFHEPEEIHTYQAWKDEGCQVQKGQKAIVQLVIWKYQPKKDPEGAILVDETAKGKMFMKKASFFSASQVEKIGA